MRRFRRAVKWVKCQGNVWCRLNDVNLGHHHFDALEGVYVIWHSGREARVVYIGQGRIRKRLEEHRNDKRVQQYATSVPMSVLFVTWAKVLAPQDRYGIEKHLAAVWNPLVGLHEDVSAVQEIEVNSPFSE